MSIFRSLLNGVNIAVSRHDDDLKRFLFGAPKPTELQKAMKELEKHPTQENEQRVKVLLQRNASDR